MGKVLSELAVYGATSHDIKPFTLERPAVTDTNFKPNFYDGLETSKLWRIVHFGVFHKLLLFFIK